MIGITSAHIFSVIVGMRANARIFTGIAAARNCGLAVRAGEIYVTAGVGIESAVASVATEIDRICTDARVLTWVGGAWNGSLAVVAGEARGAGTLSREEIGCVGAGAAVLTGVGDAWDLSLAEGSCVV